MPETDTVVAGVARQKQAAERKDLLQMILERLDQLERQLEGSGSESKSAEMRVEIDCFGCKAIAETAQECTMRSEPEQQGTRRLPTSVSQATEGNTLDKAQISTIGYDEQPDVDC